MTETHELHSSELGAQCNAAGQGFPDTYWKAEEAKRQIEANALKARQNIGLLTEEEVAAMLQLTSTGTLATWRSQKTGPLSVKLGKRVFYCQNDIAVWINNSFVKPAAEQPAKAA